MEDIFTALRAECSLRLPGVMHARQFVHVHQGDGVPRCYRRTDELPEGCALTAAQARLDELLGRPVASEGVAP